MEDSMNITAYIEAHFPPNIVALGFYKADNASSWLDVPRFMKFVAAELQSGPSSFTAPPSERFSSPVLIPESSPTPPTTVPREKRKREPKVESDSEVEIIEFSHQRQGDTKLGKRDAKRVQRRAPSPISVEDSDSASEVETRITRQLIVPELRILKEIPSTWTVFKGAYLLDLRGDTREWTDSTGKPLSMASIIKSQDQDAWGGGSGGSVKPKKCPEVIPLDNQRCQLSEHQCQGIYHCSEIDMSLLNSCERYVPDDDEMKRLFDAEREINQLESSTIYQAAAAFYQEALKQPCKAKIDIGGNPDQSCNGEPVFRLYKQKNFDGKSGFVGCSGWIRGKNSRDHRFIPIPREVKEELVKELFDSQDGSFKTKFTTKSCARVLPVRSGAKGDQECPYTHLKDGKVVQGRIVHRACHTRIKIYSPLDRSDHRAIVILTNPHNHPRFPATKLSREGKDLYKEAVRVNGISRSTALKVDMAPTTKDIFDGKIVAAVDPALGIARNKRKIVRSLKTANNPHGMGLEGVLFQKRDDDLKLPTTKRYIQQVLTQEGIDMVITTIPGLAVRVHDAEYTLHDNTYKRVMGEWKEWEVVIWDSKLNLRLTVARIYCNRETRKAFNLMWCGFWDTLERVTGRPIQFKFMDGKGLSTILVDGCKPQVDACGDSLLVQEAKRKGKSFVHETDPQVIVQYIVRTCDIHLERKLDDLAKTLPPDVMNRVRGFPFLETISEIEEFQKFCEESPYKNLRDWIIDKKSAPWFMASVNRFMSKIPEDIWLTTPGHTNLNESAHPFTNMHTGINLSLLEAINSARELDRSIEDKIQQIEASCVLINPHNTKIERDRSNRRRNETRARSAANRQDAVNKISEIEDELNNVAQTQKQAKSRERELRDLKKVVQGENGIRRSPNKQSSRGKARFPLDDAIQPESSFENVEQSISAREAALTYDSFWSSFKSSTQPQASSSSIQPSSSTVPLSMTQASLGNLSYRDIELTLQNRPNL
ncbi:hypothetical protein BDN70DRAFT_938396 [Pholiota conissans]|uniref:Uncharacterized protein n=1 Tax=Pholiota conissans TaxID=109636 RepID=A0A9P6CTI9_9AGAR|nr:hypothetical protein BDN70DRAFT_938396 [Pholiota conissans]